MAHSFDNRVENDLPSIQSLVNNFLLLDADQIGFVNGKYLFPVMEANELGLASMMCYQDWLDAYLELCVPEDQQLSNEVKTLIQRSLPQQQWEATKQQQTSASEGFAIEGIVAPKAKASVTV